MRRAALAGRIAVVVVAAAVGFGAVPALADPAATVGIGSVRPYDGNRALFLAPAWTDAAGASLTSVTADVRDGNQVVATVQLVADPDIPGNWTPSAPLELSSEGGSIPHLGAYALDISATDSDGNQLTRADAGTLDFRMTPVFRQNDDGSHETFELVSARHPQTDVGGILLGIEPGSGDSVPLTDRTVTVTQVADGAAPTSVTATTGAGGSFTTSEFAQTGPASYTSTFTESSDDVDGTATSEPGGPLVNQTTVYVTARTSAKADPGQRITISGTVRNGPRATSTPVPGVALALSLSAYSSAPVTVTSSANGTFSGSLVAVADQYYNEWSATPEGFFITGDRAQGGIVIPDESTYRSVGISIASDGVVSAHGSLQRTYADPAAVVQTQKTVLECSRDGRTGWKALAQTRTTAVVSTLQADGYVSGYYRLRHPSSDELAGATTKPVFLSRIPTRVQGNKVSPGAVKAGGTVTVTGTLQDYRSKWRAMTRRPIALYFEPRGGHIFDLVTRGRTDAHGRAKLRGTATKDGSWVLHYFGDATHFDSGATPGYVNVK